MSEQKTIGKIEVTPYHGNVDQMQKTIINTVNEFVFGDFQDNFPLGYLYEADIQAHLACKISQQITSPIIFSDEKDTYQLTPITREYPVGMRHDIVFINPYVMEDYVSWRLGKKSSIPISHILWELPLLVGIEIKYSLFGYTLHANKSGISDSEKLKKYKGDASKQNYHEERNQRSQSLNFTENFKHLSIMFFQDKGWFKKHIVELGERSLQKIDENGIDKYDAIYLVGPEKEVYRYTGDIKP